MYIDLVTINLCPGQGGGGPKPSGVLDIVENGVYNVYNYASANVDVHPSASLSETYTSNGSYNITGEFNGGVITVDVPAPQFVTETLNVSANGTYNPGQGIDGYSQVVVDVPAPQFVTETLNVSNNGTYTPSEGVDGYSQVVVDVPQSVTGFTEKQITEGVKIVDLNTSVIVVHGWVFGGNEYLKTVNLPNCETVNERAFEYCTNLTTVSLPMCTRIWDYAFNMCKKLQSIYAPNVTFIYTNTFNSCRSLQSIYMPYLSTVYYSAFQFCENLESVYIPNCLIINDNAFEYCAKLSELNLPKVSEIGARAFNYTGLNVLTLGYSSVVSINERYGIGVSSTCSIYVPASLVDAYKSARYWSRYSTQIFPISE